MTLEDFFTLTEMKGGLTAPSRVHELVAVMQKEKDCIVKNIGDTTRQWAAVASTIAATENTDCLELFIQLDGLWFIDKWLKAAQKFGNDTSDGFIEESITALLKALEKLQIDKERSVSSGIWITVNNLLDHNSSRVQDRARALCDSWKQGKVSDDIHHAEVLRDDSVLARENNDTEYVDMSIPKRSDRVENNAAESTTDGILHSSSSNCLQPERAGDLQIQMHSNELLPHKSSDNEKLEDRSPSSLTTSVISKSNPVQESSSLKEKSLASTVEGTASAGTCIVPVPAPENAEPGSISLKKLGSFSENLGLIASSTDKVETTSISSAAEGISSQETMTEPALQKFVDAKDGEFRLNSSACTNMERPVSAPKVVEDDAEKMDAKDDKPYPDTLRDLSGNGNRLVKPEDLGTSLSRMEVVGASDDESEHNSDGMKGDSDFSSPTTSMQSSDLTDRRRSNIELEYGIVDALDIARQVAQEVEREVVSYREPSGSSSEENIESGGQESDSPDSVKGKPEPPKEKLTENMQTKPNQSAEASAQEEKRSGNSDTSDTGAEKQVDELRSAQVTEAAEGPEAKTEKGQCVFDLNQDVCSDEADPSVNPISTPISVVSASRPAAASGSPMAPLQFEGTLGWKGSAATSAFRPASSWKTSDGDKTLETGGTSNSSKQRQGCLDIDLNVAEEGDEKVADLMSARQIPVSSGLQYRESSLEAGPRRSEKPNLDLNRISDDGDFAATDLRMDVQLFYPRNGHHSASPASSSSSVQPSLRNFDLNDSPLFHNESFDRGLHLGKSAQSVGIHGVSKPVDPVISIMGTRVEVGGRAEVGSKDFIPQISALPNGKPLEPAVDGNVARMGSFLGMVPAVSYSHSPGFGYNGLTTPPTLSISSSGYGPGSIPYMLDSRVAPVVPQIVGSASAAPPFLQPPFIMSMAGTPVSLNGAGPSRPNFDLNSGFALEGGSTSSFRQLFMPSQGRSVEDHLRASLQPPSSSAVGGKRKEPDGGWEPYSLHYKHQQPPWR